MNSIRRKPRCHTCGNYMEGHRRVHGSPVCPASPESTPESTLLSPPPSPERNTSISTSSSVSTTPRSLGRYSSPSTEALKLTRLPGGGWHRRNPHWTDAASAYDIMNAPVTPPAQQRVAVPYGQGPWRGPSPSTASDVSTVLVDEDGRSIRDDSSLSSFSVSSGRNSEIDWDDGSSIDSDDTVQGRYESDDTGRAVWPSKRGWLSRIADHARINRGAVTVYRAKPAEIREIERTALKHGIYAAAMSRDVSSMQGSGSKTMVVLGKSPTFVRHIANNGIGEPSQPQSHPAALTQRDSAVLNTAGAFTNGSIIDNVRNNTFIHLILASIIGGCIVIYGMSFLPLAESAATQL